jgi:SAM-dependent methyltransferase
VRSCHRLPVLREFRTEPLLAIISHLEQHAGGAIAVPDPDLGSGRYAGEVFEHAGQPLVHRSFRTWVDLAERIGLRLLTPRPLAPPMVELRFEPLDRDALLRPAAPDATERYGAASEFARISKSEDPNFVLDLRDALARVGAAKRLLDLGVNTGDEVALLRDLGFAGDIVGVDHSASALGVARTRFADVTLIEADLGSLPALGLGRFDLVLSIGTLQSPGIDDRQVLRRIVQDHLAPGGAVIIGLPNARYVAGELEHGTRMKNFRQPELGLLVKDVAFYRKYLQQHAMQVFVTGKYELLITGVSPSGASGSAPPRGR